MANNNLVPHYRNGMLAPLNSWMDSMLTEFFQEFKPFDFNSAKSRVYPKADVRKEGTDIIIEAAVPFVKKEDLEISVVDNTIVLKGEVQKLDQCEADCYFRRELTRSSFSRAFPLQKDLYDRWVDHSDGDVYSSIEATLGSGILHIRLKDILREVDERPKIVTNKVIEIKELPE